MGTAGSSTSLVLAQQQQRQQHQPGGSGRSSTKRVLPLSAMDELIEEAAADLEQLECLVAEAGERLVQLHAETVVTAEAAAEAGGRAADAHSQVRVSDS